MNLSKENNWKTAKPKVFWGEIAPCEHVLQIYNNDNIFLDTLAGYAGDGLRSGETVVIIATEEHIKGLNKRLNRDGIDLNTAIASGQYVQRNAESCLSKFLINGWPDEELFIEFVSDLQNTVKPRRRKVRAFGEMVALLWAQGRIEATIRLEELWNQFCRTEALGLFCAYPKSGFGIGAEHSITQICCAHTKIISGEKASPEIIYKG